jgi:hypothetical protein
MPYVSIISLTACVQKKPSQDQKRGLQYCVHCSIIHNSQDTESTEEDGLKKCCIYRNIYNGMLFGLKKIKRKCCHSSNMDEPGGHYSRWSMTATGREILCSHLHVEYWETENRTVVTGVGEGRMFKGSTVWYGNYS